MEVSTIVWSSLGLLTLILAIVATLNSMFTVEQNTVDVVLRWGKFVGIRHTGLNFKVPFIERFFDISLQNVSAELAFQAITQDQANVYFKALVVYAPKDASNDTIERVAFKFASEEQFEMALNKTMEGMVRSFIAGKPQKEILKLRTEISEYVKEHIKTTLDDWGYTLHDLQVNDISFDPVIMTSMAQVVASANLKEAAENEGNALLIKKTKEAEATGNAIKISAAAERDAAKLRGEGVAAFRKAVTHGVKESAEDLASSGVPDAVNLIAFSMWTEAIKHFAEVGEGNIINLDGSPDGMSKAFRTMSVKANANGVAVPA